MFASALSARIPSHLALALIAQLLVCTCSHAHQALKLPNTICASVDVTDGEALRSAMLKAEEKYGPTDLLINNAGVVSRSRLLLCSLCASPDALIMRMHLYAASTCAQVYR